jgi:hypothetical protein
MVASSAITPDPNDTTDELEVPLLRVIVLYDLPAKLAAARAAGDPEAFDRGVAEGQAWTIEQAVDAGLAGAAGSGADSG